MAKRRKKEVEQKTDHLSRVIAADSLLASTVADMEQKFGKKGILVGKQSLSRVLPVPSLAVRYILQSEGLPLSHVYQLVGAPGSFKSTMLAEMQRWHRMCAGINYTMEAETKDQDDLRWAILNQDHNACRVEDCRTMEEWQRKVLYYIESLQKNIDKELDGERIVPACFGVDSLTGKPSERNLKKIKEAGHADLQHPIEANLLKTYFQALPGELLGWPFNFVGVNHLKVNMDPKTGLPQKNIPGGWALKFQCLVVFIMKKIKTDYKKECNEIDIQIETFKNNMGPDGLRCRVKLKIYMTTDPETGEAQTHAHFLWRAASILLLSCGQDMKAGQLAQMHPKMKEICDVHEISRGSLGKHYWSKRLGVPSAEALPAEELGHMLEQRADVLDELYPVMGIKKRKFFEPAVDYLTQLDEAEVLEEESVNE